MVASKKCSTGNSKAEKNMSGKTSLNRSRRNYRHFYQSYAYFCKLNNMTPNSAVKARAGKSLLDVCGDRLKFDDWLLVTESLKYDRNLHYIAFRTRHHIKSVLEDADTEKKARAIVRRPVILSKFVLSMLLDSLARCLTESTSVTCIELDGLPLKESYVAILCKGISANSSLQTISLCNTSIGDEGCKKLCNLVKNIPTILHLDLSNCDLGVESAIAIAETLKNQYLHSFAEGWKQSLRYCKADVESMPGLRRIILNNNENIGDEGLMKLTEVLHEDVWVKAIDMQNCGIGNLGAQKVLDMLDINNTLYIVDLRDNRNIDEEIIHKIMLKLFQNNANKDAHEYTWIIPKTQIAKVSTSRPFSRQSGQSISSFRSSSTLVSQTKIERQNLQKTDSRPSSVCSIRKKIEPKQSSLLESEKNVDNPTNKTNYFILKKETCDLMFETLDKFNTFIENLKQIKKSFDEDSESKTLSIESCECVKGYNEKDNKKIENPPGKEPQYALQKESSKESLSLSETDSLDYSSEYDCNSRAFSSSLITMLCEDSSLF